MFFSHLVHVQCPLPRKLQPTLLASVVSAMMASALYPAVAAEVESADEVVAVEAVEASVVGADSVSVSSESADTASDLIRSETVVVTAARTQQQLLDTNASVSVVNANQTANLGRDNIPEMLRTAPGVRLVSDGTPGVKRVAIRGESATRTLILVDGQRIDDQKNKSGAPLLINPYFTDRIEVVKGPSSVLYGSDAMGGIVNVITKQAVEDPFAFEGGVGFNSSSNSFTEYANIMGTLDRFHYAAGAFNTNSGDLYLSDHERLDNTSYNARGLNGDFSYDVLDNLTLGYVGEYFYSDAETSTTTDNATYSVFRGEIPEWKRQKHKLYLKAYDLNDYLAAVDASFYFQSNDKEFNSTPQRGLAVGVINEQDTYGGNLQLEFSFGDTFYLVMS